MLESLVSIATELDNRGLYKEASILDSIIIKSAEDVVGNALEVASERVQEIDESLAPVRDAHETAGSILNNTKRISAIALGFVDKLMKGGTDLGGLIEGTNIPGLAFVGQLLKFPSEALAVINEVKDVWGHLYRIIKQKVDTGTLGRACISMEDITEYRDQILFFIGLLYGPLAGYVNRALGILESLESFGLTSISELTLCIGEDLKTQAQNTMNTISSSAAQWGDEINEYVAVNTHREVGDTAFA